MKKKFLFALVLIAVVSLYSCKGGKSNDSGDAMKAEKMELSQQDTSEVYNQANALLECLKNKDVDGAVSLIYTTDSLGKIIKLPEQQAAMQRAMFNNFLGLDYRINYVIFNKEKDNELKFSVILFPKTDENDHRPNEVGFILRPMRVGDQWYLTAANGSRESFNSEIQN